MQLDELEWPNRERRIDVAWALFALVNLAAILAFPTWETVPFHFIWVSLTLLYGFRVWKAGPTFGILAVVMASTALFIGLDISRGTQTAAEFTEVPLMAAMFLAMVWHAHRRLTAMKEVERVSLENLRLLERERRFVQDASHELRTPITVALGHAELMQRGATNPTIAEDAGVIADELMRLRRLADRLLILAGIEDPEFLHLRPVDLETVVVDTVRRWTATPRRWLLSNAEEATVLADADRFSVALDALIENAVKHTQPDDTIEVSVRRVGTSAVISVRDTGAGIPAADLEHIFDRFARADPGRSRHTGGFGLGLSIVREIVKGHGGTVNVKSTLGEGTTFDISLPTIKTAPTKAAGTRQGDAEEVEEAEDVDERAAVASVTDQPSRLARSEGPE
jgi:signal transduction histidine kinase